MSRDALGHSLAKGLTVDRERSPGRHGALVGAGQNQRAELLQLVLEQARRPIWQNGAQRVAAHQLGKAIGLMRGRTLPWPHLEQRDVQAPLGRLPGRLRARQSAADHG